jgi:hypothetical protein
MLILITNRESELDEGLKPHPKAFRSTRERWETRSCSEARFNEKFAAKEGEWRSKGTEHKVEENGYISRRMEGIDAWRIEVDSLEHLFSMMESKWLLAFLDGEPLIQTDYED